VGTLHLVVYALLVLLVVPVAIEVPASVGGGGARSILSLFGPFGRGYEPRLTDLPPQCRTGKRSAISPSFGRVPPRRSLKYSSGSVPPVPLTYHIS
jgi:hypothetical protein